MEGFERRQGACQRGFEPIAATVSAELCSNTQAASVPWRKAVAFLPRSGSASISVQIVLVKRDQAGAEQFDAGAAIHGPFEHLQSIDLPLCLSAAPRQLW